MQNNEVFKNKLFPTSISYGALSSIRTNTDIVQVSSGKEKININWQDPLHEYNVSHNLKSREQIEVLNTFNYTMMGPAHSFKFKDWVDYYCLKEMENGISNEDGKLLGEPIIELWKKYGDINDETFYSRRIKLISIEEDIKATDIDRLYDFELYIDNVLVNNYELDHLNGTVKLMPIYEYNISNISIGTTTTITVNNHNLTKDDIVYLDGVANLENNTYLVLNVIDSNNILINLNSVDLTIFGGKVKKFPQGNTKILWQGEFFVETRFLEDVFSVSIPDYEAFDVNCRLKEKR